MTRATIRSLIPHLALAALLGVVFALTATAQAETMLPRPGYSVLEHPPALTAHDGQTLGNQPDAARTAYDRAYGGGADAQWVYDHHVAIVAIEAAVRIESDPNAPVILDGQVLTVEAAPRLIAAGVVARGQTYAYLIGCDNGSLWGMFGCGGVYATEPAQGGQPGSSVSKTPRSTSGSVTRTGDGPTPTPTATPTPKPVVPVVSPVVTPAPDDTDLNAAWTSACDAFQRYEATPVPDGREEIGDRWVESLFHPTDRTRYPCDRDEELPVREREVTVEVEVKDEVVEGDAAATRDTSVIENSQSSSVVERGAVAVRDGTPVTITTKDPPPLPPPSEPPCKAVYRVFHAAHVTGLADGAKADHLANLKTHIGKLVYDSILTAERAEAIASAYREYYLSPYNFYTEDGVELACRWVKAKRGSWTDWLDEAGA